MIDPCQTKVPIDIASNRVTIKAINSAGGWLFQNLDQVLWHQTFLST